MRFIVIICLLFSAFILIAGEPGGNLPSQGVLGKDISTYFDPAIDYSRQTARVTDYGDQNSLFKFKFENNNIKFLKKGDLISFRVLNQNSLMCQAQVQGVEDFYVIVKVESLSPCWKGSEYFRRGTIVYVSMPILIERMHEAVQFRKGLTGKKSDFLTQLKDLNNFLYLYDQEKVKLIVEYDERIARLLEEKKKAIRALMAKRKESYDLREVLKRELDKTDRDLNFYRLERQEPLVDRWDQSHDLGLPLARRPQKTRQQRDSSKDNLKFFSDEKLFQ